MQWLLHLTEKTHLAALSEPVPKKDGFTDQMELGVLEKYKKAIQFIEDVTRNAEEGQKSVLSEILTKNGHVEYLQRHRPDGRIDLESLKRLLPVVDYEDMKPDIQRITNGDTSPILCGRPISELITSSGTSAGEAKLIPSTEEELERRSLWYKLLMPMMNQFVPGLDKGKGLYFLFVRVENKTTRGLVVHPVLTSLTRTSNSMTGLMIPTTSTPAPLKPFFAWIPTKACILNCFVGFTKTNKLFEWGRHLPPVWLKRSSS